MRSITYSSLFLYLSTLDLQKSCLDFGMNSGTEEKNRLQDQIDC